MFFYLENIDRFFLCRIMNLAISSSFKPLLSLFIPVIQCCINTMLRKAILNKTNNIFNFPFAFRIISTTGIYLKGFFPAICFKLLCVDDVSTILTNDNDIILIINNFLWLSTNCMKLIFMCFFLV